MDEVLTVLLGAGGVAQFYLPCLVLGAMTVSLLSPVYSFIAHLFQPIGYEFIAH